MSKRVSNKSNAPRKGKLHGRQRVRLGWRKRRIRDMKFLLAMQAAHAEAMAAAQEIK